MFPVRPALAALLTLAVAACATATPSAAPATFPSSPSPSPSPALSATAGPSAASGAEFASERHGYRLTVPPGWTVTETPGNGGLHPDEPGVDTFRDTVGTSSASPATRRHRWRSGPARSRATSRATTAWPSSPPRTPWSPGCRPAARVPPPLRPVRHPLPHDGGRRRRPRDDPLARVHDRPRRRGPADPGRVPVRRWSW